MEAIEKTLTEKEDKSACGTADLMMGAIAFHHDLTVVTSNVKHFENIAELEVENWKN